MLQDHKRGRRHISPIKPNHGSDTTCWESPGELGKNNRVNAPGPQD
ncbi:hypothetical protein A2U01_0079823, partial [Trifolium medium]|nr:hypothetical protein [Trifolium medium]